MIKNSTLTLNKWFDNLKQNKLNDEILCIFFNKKDINNQNNCDKKINSILKNNNIDFNFYQIIYEHNIDNISNMKMESNIILASHIDTDILKINDCHTKLICLSIYKLIIYFKYLHLTDSECIYIEKYDPIAVLKDYFKIKEEELNQHYNTYYHNDKIYNVIFLKFNYFSNINCLKSDNLLASKFIMGELEYDINVLCYRNILTSKLAIALYKILTLRFNDSNTKIGTYYRKGLGISSKTTQLPNFQKEKIITDILREKKIEISSLKPVDYYNKNKDKFEEAQIKYITELPILRAKAYNLNDIIL